MPRGPKPQDFVALTSDELKKLQHMARLRESASYSRVLRAKIVLAAYEHPDWNNAEIAKKLATSVGTVHKWRKRWRETKSLKEAQRHGAPRFFSLNPTGPNHRARLHAA